MITGHRYAVIWLFRAAELRLNSPEKMGGSDLRSKGRTTSEGQETKVGTVSHISAKTWVQITAQIGAVRAPVRVGT